MTATDSWAAKIDSTDDAIKTMNDVLASCEAAWLRLELEIWFSRNTTTIVRSRDGQEAGGRRCSSMAKATLASHRCVQLSSQTT